MTHPYTKLAEWHEAMAKLYAEMMNGVSEKHAETARILRSAAGVDVDGFMDLAGAYAYAMSSGDGDAAAKINKQLESALRMALAAREGFVLVPVEPTPGMLFAGDDVNAECQAEGVSPVNAIYHAMITSAPVTAAPKATL